VSFESDLIAFTKKAEKNAEKIFRGTTISLFGKIIKRTPVKSGRLKGNWQIDINAPASGTVDTTDTTPIKGIGAGSTLKIASKVKIAELHDSIYMTNNLPYAQLVENGNYSTQSPAGMVGVSIAEFQREVERQARKVK